MCEQSKTHTHTRTHPQTILLVNSEQMTPASNAALISSLGKDNGYQGRKLQIRVSQRSKVERPFVFHLCVRLTRPVKKEEAIKAAQVKGMCVMLLHQLSVSVAFARSIKGNEI